jgi:hypothetical protein
MFGRWTNTKQTKLRSFRVGSRRPIMSKEDGMIQTPESIIDKTRLYTAACKIRKSSI